MASSTSRDAVNPLRPYYKPPTIGERTEAFSRAGPSPPNAAGGNSSAQYASKARDIFPDLNYRDYVNDPSPSTVQSIKELVDELLWKYTSVLMAQPFEVAKTVLQVRMQDDVERLAAAAAAPAAVAAEASPSKNPFDEYSPDSDESDDETSYFGSNNANLHTPTPSSRSSRSRRREQSPFESLGANPAAKSELPPHMLNLRRPDSILEAMSQLWSKEGAWGVWKGSNATFLYTVLQSLLENWSRSLLSALFNVPDLGVKDDVQRLVEIASPYPWASLCVAAAAAVATGLILAPLDIVRTRLILTPTGRGSRRTISTLRSLPSWLCPGSLFVPTMLHSLIHPVLTLSTPLVLRSQFLIDKELSPTTFSVAKFCTSFVSLFIKLPLETVLRRGQAAVLRDPAYMQALDQTGTLETIIEPGPYYGVLGTMYCISSEEGSRAEPVEAKGSRAKKAKVAAVVYKRGQGMQGLWRGWKVSSYGLMGLWAAGMFGGGGEGEF